MMQLIDIRKRWSSKKCPFAVADHCILDECGAWHETKEFTTDEKKVDFRSGMRHKPDTGWFGADKGWDYEVTKWNEYRYGKYDQYEGSDPIEFRWSRTYWIGVDHSATGGCKRMRD